MYHTIIHFKVIIHHNFGSTNSFGAFNPEQASFTIFLIVIKHASTGFSMNNNQNNSGTAKFTFGKRHENIF